MGIQKGIYRHFKGNRYEVLELARHSETAEQYVVYRALYGDGGVWVRPQSMFEEIIVHDGKRIARFSLEQPNPDPIVEPDHTSD
jgi:cyclomaltodextrinase / maltogenic alpha-amylase / neopullulanase